MHYGIICAEAPRRETTMALKYNIVKTKQYKRDCKAAMKSGCTAEAAESIRARLEVEADRAHFRKTGKHLLPVVSARDLERHPELAVQDEGVTAAE